MDFHAEYSRRCYMGGDIHAHLPTLFEYASAGDVKIIELGVRGGDSTTAFLAAIELYGGHLWSCDIDLPWFLNEYQTAAGDVWTFVLADDIEAEHQAPNKVDILFIDTSHTYDHTRRELDVYASHVKPGGVILLHDTELEQPADSPPSDPPFPVLVAVTEFCESTGWELKLIPGCNGLGIIRSTKGECG